MQLPAYSTDNVLVIYGLINPTLVVPRGATLHVLVANLDEETYHNFALAAYGPPYYSMGMMQGGMMGGRDYGVFLYTMPMLSPADYSNGWAPVFSYAFTIPNVSSLWYLCDYPGHAQSGMYGEVTVR